MSKVYETLKKKNDPSVEVYPNIESQNIPNNAIDTSKISDGAITTNKIVDNTIITDKIVDKAVTKDKLATGLQEAYDIVNDVFDEDGNIDTEDIICDDITIRNTATFNGDVYCENDVTFDNIPQCDKVAKYAIFARDNDYDKYCGLIGYTECDLSNYTEVELQVATDFDKALISDWSQTSIDILIEIFTNIQSSINTHLGTQSILIIGVDRYLMITNSTNSVRAKVINTSNNQTIYDIQIDTSTKTITSYTYNGSEYFFLELYEEKTMI